MELEDYLINLDDIFGNIKKYNMDINKYQNLGELIIDIGRNKKNLLLKDLLIGGHPHLLEMK
jgi:hypothetical protein